MNVFKVTKGINQCIKLTENSFIEATNRKYPFYQTINDEKKQYAFCPACENPVVMIHLHVDEQFVDENKRKVSMHARHLRQNVAGLGEYDQEAYESCPYANPSSSTSKARRPEGNTSNEILDLLKIYPDLIDTAIRRSIGIRASEKLFSSMVKNFKEEQGHLYRYVTKINLPYSFAYMSDSQNLFFATFDTTYESGKELLSEFNEKSKWCTAYQFGKIDRKKEVKGKRQYVELEFHFTDFNYSIKDEEKYQFFELIITESMNGDSNEIVRKKITFDQYYFINSINRRANYQALVKNIY